MRRFFPSVAETLTEDEIMRMYNKETSGEYMAGLSFQCFESYLEEVLIWMAKTGGGAFKKLLQYIILFIGDIDEDRQYKFYEKYFKELSKSEKKWETKAGKDSVGKKSCICRANRYLSELLFAYLYYERTFKWTKKMIDEHKINDDIFREFLDIIYEVSKSPACFSRNGHIKHYATKFLSISASEKGIAEIELSKLKNSMVENEKYSVQKFLPAFFYGFLYYLKKAGIIKEEDEQISLAGFEDCIMKNIKPFEMLDKVSFQSWMRTSEAKKLWIKRKIDYFKPLDYEIGKALF